MIDQMVKVSLDQNLSVFSEIDINRCCKNMIISQRYNEVYGYPVLYMQVLVMLIIKQCLHGGAALASLFKRCLLSIKQGDGVSLGPFLLSLYASRAKHQLETLHNLKPTHKKDFSQTSASQLASALISPWNRVIFQLGALALFIVCR